MVQHLRNLPKGKDKLKGWYCNIAEPAIISDEGVSFVDLALDVLVFPKGKIQVLDEDEFQQLKLTPDQTHKALHAVEELKELFHPPINLRLDIKK